MSHPARDDLQVRSTSGLCPCVLATCRRSRFLLFQRQSHRHRSPIDHPIPRSCSLNIIDYWLRSYNCVGSSTAGVEQLTETFKSLLVRNRSCDAEQCRTVRNTAEQKICGRENRTQGTGLPGHAKPRSYLLSPARRCPCRRQVAHRFVVGIMCHRKGRAPCEHLHR
jgi:hypothetical protein